MLLLLSILGAGVGATGLLLLLRGLASTSPTLDALVSDLERPRTPAPPGKRGQIEVLEQLAGRRTPERDAQLALLERSTGKFVNDRIVWAALGTAPGILAVAAANAGLYPFLTPLVAFGVLVGGAAGGWLWALNDLRSDAAKAGREFRHALAAYLELVTILMAGGAGVETAIYDAAAIGNGPAFRHMATALSAASARREPPWKQLGALGERIGVAELGELEAAMTLAGGGAHVRDTLASKAESLRERDLAAVEAQAEARSETMVLPVAMMFAGFLLLLGYPALAGLSP
jgi:tight adherence protein C